MYTYIYINAYTIRLKNLRPLKTNTYYLAKKCMIIFKVRAY